MKTLFTILLSGLLSLGAHGQSLNQLLPIKKDQLWGFIDYNGNTIIEPQYQSESYFDSYGLCSIKKNGQSGVIDTNNKVIVPFQYKDCSNLNGVIIRTLHNESYGFYNLITNQHYDLRCQSIELIDSNRLKIRKGTHYGVISYDNKTLVDFNYQQISWKRGYLHAYNNNQHVDLYKPDGQLVFKSPYDNINPINDSLLFFKTKNGWGLINNKGIQLIPDQYKFIINRQWPLYEIVTKSSKTGLYNLEYDSLLIDTVFRSVSIVDSNFYMVIDSNYNRKLVTKTGVLVNIPYADIRSLNKEYSALFGSNGIWSIVKVNGEIIGRDLFDQFTEVDNNLIVFIKNNKYGVFNLNTASTIIPPKFKSIEQGLSSFKANDGKDTYLFTYNKNGIITDRSKFSNFASISIGPRPTFNPIRIARNPIPLTNDTLDPLKNGFVFYKGYYFLTNSKGQRIPTPYDNVTIIPNSRFALVTTSKTPIAQDVFGKRFHYGLVDYIRRRPITNPSFWNIDSQNLYNNQFITRAISEGGRRCFIDQKGKIHYHVKVKYGTRYKTEPIGHIGSFQDGLAKINVDGYYNKRRSYTNQLDNVVVQDFKKWGYINSNGKVVIPPVFNRAFTFNLGLAKVGVSYNKGIGYGMINTKQDTIVNFIYDKIQRLDNSGDSLIQTTFKRRKQGIINSKGKVITDPIFDQIDPFKNGYAVVRIGNKYGLIDTNGNITIPTRYRKIGYASKEGLIKVMTKNKWGYLNVNGDTIIKEQYYFAGIFVNGLAYVKVEGGYGFINPSGTMVIKAKFDKAKDFNNGYAIVKKNGKYGVIDPTGSWAIPATNYYVYSVSKEGVVVYKSKKKGWYKAKTVDGKSITKGEVKNKLKFNEGIARFKKGSRYGYVDTVGNQISKAKYRYCGDFSQGLAKVKKDGLWGYINKADTFVIAPTFKYVSDFSSGYAVAQKADSVGLITLEGEFKYLPNATKINGFKNGFCIVHNQGFNVEILDTNLNVLDLPVSKSYKDFDGGYFRMYKSDKAMLINRDGDIILSAAFNEISNFTNGFATYSTGQLIGVYDLKGNELLETKYNYLKPIDNGLYEVHMGGKIGYLRKNGTWLWAPNN